MPDQPPDQPNKPGGDFAPSGKPRDAGDEQAVRNQGEVSPDDYPEPASGPNSATGEGADRR